MNQTLNIQPANHNSSDLDEACQVGMSGRLRAAGSGARRSAGRPMAFTLIELLVVIAIIALLASILMPALQKAMEMARMVKCASQMKGHGLGYHLYAAENNDYIVSTAYPHTWAGSTSQQGYELIRRQLLKHMGSLAPANLDPAHPNAASSNEAFLCPTATSKNESWPFSSMSNSTVFTWQKVGLWPNVERVQPTRFEFQGVPTNVDIYTRQFSMFPVLSRVVAEGDSASTYVNSLNPAATWGKAKFRHVDRSVNLLMADGHAEKFMSDGFIPNVTGNRYLTAWYE